MLLLRHNERYLNQYPRSNDCTTSVPRNYEPGTCAEVSNYNTWIQSSSSLGDPGFEPCT
jgi:hypothetical protein